MGIYSVRLPRFPEKQEGILIELRTSQPTRCRSCLQGGVSGVQMHNKFPSQRKYGPIDPPRACIAAKYAANLRESAFLQCVPQVQLAKDPDSTGSSWRGPSCRRKWELLTRILVEPNDQKPKNTRDSDWNPWLQETQDSVPAVFSVAVDFCFIDAP